MSYCQTYHRTVCQGILSLYQAFPERTASYNKASVPILYSSGNNFTGRSRITVYQQHNSPVFQQAFGSRIFLPAAGRKSIRINNHFLISEHIITDADSCPHISSDIGLQIQNQVFHSFCLHLFHSFLEFINRIGCKTGNFNISRRFIQHISRINTMKRYHSPDNTEIHRFRATHHAYLHHCSLLPLQPLPYLGIGQFYSGDIFTVHRHDSVPCQQSYLFGRTAGHNRNDHQGILINRKLYSYSEKSALQRFVHFLNLLFGNINGMRVQIRQDLYNCLFRQFRQIYRIDIKSID